MIIILSTRVHNNGINKRHSHLSPLYFISRKTLKNKNRQNLSLLKTWHFLYGSQARVHHSL